MQDKFAVHKFRAIAILLLIIAATAVLRCHLLEVPLDRDEGGYAYTGQLVLEGTAPFAGAYDMKMPGLYYVYALILLVFGQSTTGIHLGLLVFNSAAIAIIYLIGKRLFDTTAGIIAAAFYGVMSLSQAVLGFSANAEHLLLVPALGGILLLLVGLDSQRSLYFLASGLLLGTAFIIKHQGIFFAGFAALYLFISFIKLGKKQRGACVRQYLLFLVGLAVPFSVLCLYFWSIGLFGKFWFWLFVYPQEYASQLSFHEGVGFFTMQISKMAHGSIGFWLLAVIGLTTLVFKRNLRPHLLFMILFLLFSVAVLMPGYYFYPHYFVLVLPVIAILAGLGTDSLAALLSQDRSKIKMIASVLLAAGAIVCAIGAERAYLFTSTPAAISRAAFNMNPFPESIEIAEYIKKHSQPEDTIAVIGSEPQIFFYAHRRSATPHIYIYPLVKAHKFALPMQREMIHDIEIARPKFIVFVFIPESWLMDKKADRTILTWFKDYGPANYEVAGTVQIMPDGIPIYRWGSDSIASAPQSSYWLEVFERKTP
jgi:hypothetical protein